jgi:hypothetical protein
MLLTGWGVRCLIWWRCVGKEKLLLAEAQRRKVFPDDLPPYGQSFDGVGGMTFISNSSSVRPPAAIRFPVGRLGNDKLVMVDHLRLIGHSFILMPFSAL